MTLKPPIPVALTADPERMPLDESEGGAFQRVLSIAVWSAESWFHGPDGPYACPEMTGSERTRGVLHEGLAHLLELGIIDIDAERLAGFERAGVPIGRVPRPAQRLTQAPPRQP